MTDQEKLDIIVEVICRHENVTLKQLRTPSSTRKNSQARDKIWYFGRKFTGITYKKLGLFVRRTAWTAMTGIHVIENMMKYNGLTAEINDLEQEIFSRFKDKNVILLKISLNGETIEEVLKLINDHVKSVEILNK